MILDQLFGRFAWYRRHRGGLWSRIPGPGGGYFHHPSTRDHRGDWAILATSLRERYAPAWLDRALTRTGGRIASLRDRIQPAPGARASSDRDPGR
jgi:hypothetical protein